MIGSPWTGPVPRSADEIAVSVDVCVREDYDEAQRVARLRARFRGLRQFVAWRYWSGVRGQQWTVYDVERGR